MKKIKKKTIDVMLWHQGEQDGWTRSDLDLEEFYRSALTKVIDQYRSEEFSDNNMPFIVGETSGAYNGINKGWEARNPQLNELNHDADPNTKCVYLSDLSTTIDNVHFSSKTQRLMGLLYFKAFRESFFI